MSDWGFVKFSILMGCLIGAVSNVEPLLSEFSKDVAFVKYLTNLCCCLPAMFGGIAAVSLTLLFEKDGTMRAGQAAWIGLLAGIISVPIYFAGVVTLDALSSYFLTFQVDDFTGNRSDMVKVMLVPSLIRNFFRTVIFAPASLLFATLGATLSLQLLHKGRIHHA